MMYLPVNCWTAEGFLRQDCIIFLELRALLLLSFLIFITLVFLYWRENNDYRSDFRRGELAGTMRILNDFPFGDYDRTRSPISPSVRSRASQTTISPHNGGRSTGQNSNDQSKSISMKDKAVLTEPEGLTKPQDPNEAAAIPIDSVDATKEDEVESAVASSRSDIDRNGILSNCEIIILPHHDGSRECFVSTREILVDSGTSRNLFEPTERDNPTGIVSDGIAVSQDKSEEDPSCDSLSGESLSSVNGSIPEGSENVRPLTRIEQETKQLISSLNLTLPRRRKVTSCSRMASLRNSLLKRSNRRKSPPKDK